MSANSPQADASLDFRCMLAPAPFHCIFFPCDYPLGEAVAPLLTSFLESLSGFAQAEWTLRPNVFLQLEQLHTGDCRQRFARHAGEWIPEVGLGIWPAEPPPTTWTREDFLKIPRGGRVRPLMYQVFWISASPSIRASARRTLLDVGPLVQVMGAEQDDVFLDRTVRLYQPGIQDPSLTCYPFYLPLLDLQTISAADHQQLSSWLCGARVYIRQSFEDKGLIVLTDQPLTIALKSMGGFQPESEDGFWRIPFSDLR